MGATMNWTFSRACTFGTALLISVTFSGCPNDALDDATFSFDAGPPASQCPASTPEFTVGSSGLSTSNAELNVKVRVEDADYRPPRFGINSWTIAITDLNGQPLPDASLQWACAFMPAHGHGSNPRSVEKLDGGLWKLNNQNMSMQGGWEIQLWIDPMGGESEFMGAPAGINKNACTAPSGKTATLILPTCVPRKADGS